MKKILLIPTNPDQKPIVIYVQDAKYVQNFIELTMTDGKKQYLPRDQVKEWKLADAITNNRATRRARRKQKP